MIAIHLVVLVALLALSAFFSGSETMLFSLTGTQRARIRAKSAKADQRIGRCVNDSARLLSTILVGNTFVNFAVAVTGYSLFREIWPAAGGWASVPAMTALLLLFGEITPKRLALRHAEALAPACARMLLLWRAALAPFNAAFRFSTRAFAPMLTRERRALSDAELVSVVEAAADRGEFAAADAEMIAGVLRLSELRANDEMTPRVDMEGDDCDLPDDERLRRRARARHRFLPVFRRTPDAVEGVFDLQTGRTESALFVPEQMTLDDLLVKFRETGRQLAVVTDEYGGTAGVITPNDVLEIVMGPGVFASPDAEPAIVPDGPRTWIVDGRASLDEVNRALGVELEAEDADRIAGWVAFHAERIPRTGEMVEADGCRATVAARRRRRVTRVRIEVLEYPRAESDAELLAETDEAVEKTEEDNA